MEVRSKTVRNGMQKARVYTTKGEAGIVQHRHRHITAKAQIEEPKKKGLSGFRSCLRLLWTLAVNRVAGG